MGAEDNTQNLRTFMTLVGGRDGLKAIRSFLEVYPDGFNGLDSLVHGVALQHPQETVNGYNELPDDSKLRNRALPGLMWGLAHNGTSVALTVFADLDPRDQAASIVPLADSYSMAKGFAGADELLSSLPASYRDTALHKMLPHLASQPPEGFVNWGAKYCDTSGAVAARFQTAAASFAAASPENAIAWAEQNAAGKETSTAAGIVIASLLPSRPGLVRNWLDRNPNHPAAEDLRASLPP